MKLEMACGNRQAWLGLGLRTGTLVEWLSVLSFGCINLSIDTVESLLKSGKILRCRHSWKNSESFPSEFRGRSGLVDCLKERVGDKNTDGDPRETERGD